MSRLALTLALLALPALARADLAPSPPSNCPLGAAPRVGPTTGWCEPTTCTADSDCEAGQTCSAEEIGLCVYEEAIPTVRVSPLDEPREVPTRTVRMARDRGCEPDGTCLNMQSTCERARRCVAAPPPAPPPPTPPATVGPAPAQAEDEPTAAADTSGGCSVGASGSPVVASGLALAALFTWVARRRRT